MVRTTTFQPRAQQHPDPVRILAISASIAINVAALALLMRPPEFTPLAAQADTAPPIEVIRLQKPQKPIVVPIEKPHLQPIHHETQQTVRQPPVQVVTHDTNAMSIEHIAFPPSNTDVHIDEVALPQLVEAGLTPTASPAPTYPRDALRDGIVGTVELELLVGVDGRVLEVHVTHSSGNHLLDGAARDQVLRNWRFQPAMRNGIAVQALGRVPIVFTLDGR